MSPRPTPPSPFNKSNSANATGPQHYNWLMVVLHSLMALGLAVAFAVGLYMVDIEGITPWKLKLFNWHKWLGVALLALVLVRLVVRFGSALPHHPPQWAKPVHLAVHAGHWALYAFMLLVPVVGYLYSLAAGFPVVWFGIIKLPVLIGPNPEWKPILKDWHEWLAKGLAVMVLGHVAMAIKHHVWDKDLSIRRMFPSCAKKCTANAAANSTTNATAGRLGSWALALGLTAGLTAGLAVGLAGAVLWPAPVQAAPIDPARSHIKVTLKQLGVPITGQFKRLEGDVAYNAAQPANSRATVVVPAASFDLGDAQFNKEVAGPEWFDAARHPQARFVLTRLVPMPAKPGGAVQFQAEGQLTLRGITKPLRCVVGLTTQAGAQVLVGQAAVRRLDHQVGAKGDWADTSLVANEVVVDFRLTVPVAKL